MIENELYGGTVPPNSGRFPYSATDNGGGEVIGGGKVLYFIAKAVLLRETMTTGKLNEESRVKIRNAIQPHFSDAYTALLASSGPQRDFASVNSYYQICYLARATGLLLRNENTHGNIKASRNCLALAKKLLTRCDQLSQSREGEALQAGDYSHYYLLLAKSCLLREIASDIQRYDMMIKPNSTPKP